MLRLLVLGVCAWWLSGAASGQESWTRRDRSAKQTPAAQFNGDR